MQLLPLAISSFSSIAFTSLTYFSFAVALSLDRIFLQSEQLQTHSNISENQLTLNVLFLPFPSYISVHQNELSQVFQEWRQR
jgi:hypothetical protein